ncbi:MAG: anhydro-N-acetylmuramic acid kinase, partial [Alphaproteobacteria bacterium]|nr:anhydro-N-acetylmuramic acid kinase [Alphaproteobacteria bacterium]
MSNIKTLKALGIAVSTANDGVEIAEILTDGVDVKEIHKAYNVPLDEDLREKLSLILHGGEISPDQFSSLDNEFSDFCAGLITNFLKENESKIDVIGIDGYTVYHDTAAHRTKQLGSGRILSQILKIPAVSNLAGADMLNGGQGYPLSPVYFEALLNNHPRPLAVVEISGLSEIVFLGASGEMTAFVSGPGNAVINDWVAKHGGLHTDYNGRLAILGKINDKILLSLMHHKYLAKIPPKACDKTEFNHKTEHLEGLSLEDGTATVTAFVAEAIAYSMALYLPEVIKDVYVCGAGAKNPTLMRFLRQRLPNAELQILKNPENVAAQTAAFLAARRINLLPSSFPFTTGVPVPCICGEL